MSFLELKKKNLKVHFIIELLQFRGKTPTNPVIFHSIDSTSDMFIVKATKHMLNLNNSDNEMGTSIGPVMPL